MSKADTISHQPVRSPQAAEIGLHPSATMSLLILQSFKYGFAGVNYQEAKACTSGSIDLQCSSDDSDDTEGSGAPGAAKGPDDPTRRGPGESGAAGNDADGRRTNRGSSTARHRGTRRDGTRGNKSKRKRSTVTASGTDAAASRPVPLCHGHRATLSTDSPI